MVLRIRLFRKSGLISEQELELFVPGAYDGRVLAVIPDSETLFRRFQPDHFDNNGDLVPTYFPFPGKKDDPKSGQSFLLKGIASPYHALHRNCNDGKKLKSGLWEVFRISVADIPKQIADPQMKIFYFRMIHTPYAECKAHCELFCSDEPQGNAYVIPGQVVKTKLRIQLSRCFKPTGVRLFA